MMRPLISWLTLATAASLAAAAACGGGSDGPEPFPFPTDTGKKDQGGGGDADAASDMLADAVDAAGDAALLDGDAELLSDVPDVPAEPWVVLEGLVSMDAQQNVLCARPAVVAARAGNIGERVLRLVVEKKWLLDVAPAVDPEDAERYLFDVDLSVLALPEGGEPVEGEPNLEDGDSVDLMVAAFPSDVEPAIPTIPADSDLRDERTFKLDSRAPTLALAEPDPSLVPHTLTGLARVSGSVTDSVRVGRVDVRFDGELLASLDATPEELKSQTFEIETDLRLLPTVYKPLSVEAVDACGFESAWSEPVKVVRWPWLRTYQPYTLPQQKIIRDSFIVDWDGDGYPDVLLATDVGVFLARNGGDAAPGDLHEMEQLTTRRTSVVSSVDLDGDGDVDLAAVESVVGQGRELVVRRNLGDLGLYEAESHSLPISDDSDVVDIVVADFTGDAVANARDDIVIATNDDAESLVFFKRQNADEPQEFDQCQEVTVDAGPEAPDAADGQGSTIVCPELFAPAVLAGGAEGITQISVRDISGATGPDGYTDVIAGVDDLNAIYLFENRYADGTIQDTPFKVPVKSTVWPDQDQNKVAPRHFCVANIIETGEADDPLDLVVGTAQDGTWRVMRGLTDGYWARFTSDRLDAGDPYDMLSMSGTAGGDITGVVCADFDQDGHQDVALVSADTNVLQVHLGDGAGRFNQTPGQPLLNPVNEGIGFAVGDDPEGLRVADFDQDGYPDLMLDFRMATFAVLRNTTTAEMGFDLDATRLLVAPLGRKGTVDGGMIEHMALGDLNGDGKPELAAVTPSDSLPDSNWLSIYHTLGAAYRDWFGSDLKEKESNVFYVWGQGSYGPDMPSYPAAYDHIPGELYGRPAHGPVDASHMEIVDLVGPDSLGPDGLGDVVLSGKAGGPTKSMVALYANSAPDGDFWDEGGLARLSGSMFTPWGRSLLTGSYVGDFALIAPDEAMTMPSLVIAVDKYALEPSCVPTAVRVCPWDAIEDYWVCPFWADCNSHLGKQVPEEVVDIERIAVSGDGEGEVTGDPTVPAELLLLGKRGDSYAHFPWKGEDPAFPYGYPLDKGVGQAPLDMALRDLDGDELIDLAVVVYQNVMVAYGTPSPLLHAFEAPLPVDRRPNFTQSGPNNVTLSDINKDGTIDVVFAERNKNRVVIYLNIGLDPEGSQTRQYHGPIYVPTCAGPTEVLAYDFDGDGCETVVALCELAGSIALLANDTCEHL